MAPGYDGLNNNMIQKLSCNIVQNVIVIYNSALKLQHFLIGRKQKCLQFLSQEETTNSIRIVNQ